MASDPEHPIDASPVMAPNPQAQAIESVSLAELLAVSCEDTRQGLPAGKQDCKESIHAHLVDVATVVDTFRGVYDGSSVRMAGNFMRAADAKCRAQAFKLIGSLVVRGGRFRDEQYTLDGEIKESSVFDGKLHYAAKVEAGPTSMCPSIRLTTTYTRSWEELVMATITDTPTGVAFMQRQYEDRLYKELEEDETFTITNASEPVPVSVGQLALAYHYTAKLFNTLPLHRNTATPVNLTCFQRLQILESMQLSTIDY